MKSIGSFVLIVAIMVIAFCKCTSDETKAKVFSTVEKTAASQLKDVNERIESGNAKDADITLEKTINALKNEVDSLKNDTVK